MTYIQNINQKDNDKIVSEAGKAAHVVRNYLQGYVNLNNPEIYTIDTLVAQIEALVRTIKIKIQTKQDFLNELAMSIKTSKFLLQLINSNFMQCKDLKDSLIKKVKICIELMQKLLTNIHITINNIILQQSQEVTGITMPKLPSQDIPKEMTNALYNCFISEKYTKDLNFDQRIPLQQQQDRINKLGQFICNKAHMVQDEVSEFQQENGKLGEMSKKITQTAGQIENNSRAIQRIIINHDNKIPLKAIQKQLKAIKDNLQDLNKYNNTQQIPNRFDNIKTLIDSQIELHKYIEKTLKVNEQVIV